MMNIFEKGIDKSSEKEGKHPDFDLIAEKLMICRFATTEKFGSVNIYQSVANLYAALYEPEMAEQITSATEEFPDRINIFKKPLSRKPVIIPSKEEFIERIRHAMTDIEYGDCLSEEAKKQFRFILEESEHAVIWTDGDVYGVPEHNLPGSKEQLKKLASAQFYNKVRREIAQERGIHHSEVLSVVAVEGKMKFIPKIVEEFTKKGIERIFILEDRANNIKEALELIKQSSSAAEVFPVWIRVGIYGNRIGSEVDLERMEKEFHAIDNISQLMQVLEGNRVFESGKKVGSIIDLDGPLHDDGIRKKLQTEAVIKKLKDNGWI